MAFRSQLKIRFGDIDHAGIVYYPRFLHYFHVALEEFFGQELEIDYPVLIDEHHLGLPTVHLETDFSRPLRYGRVFKQGENEPCIEGHNVTVCLDMDTFKKRDIPDWLRQRLEKQIHNT
jgi:4-hydroxybenzoyl-CoA thioesterase